MSDKPIDDGMTDLQRVIEGLSEAEREVFRMEPWRGWKIFTWWPDHLHHAMQRLQIDGLFDCHPHWNARWNALGLAVRATILSKEPTP